MSENDVLKSICEYLWYNEIFFWRNNNTPVFDATRKVYRAMPKWGMNGVADILGIYKGRLLAIEVKKNGSYPSAVQKQFIKRVNDEGGIAFIAKSIEDVEKHLRVYGNIL